MTPPVTQERPGVARLALGSAGIAMGLVGVWQFVAQVPTSSQLRVLVWFVGGLLAHDAVLAPLAVVVGWLLARRAPAHCRFALRILALTIGTVLLLALPLLATGGLRT